MTEGGRKPFDCEFLALGGNFLFLLLFLIVAKLIPAANSQIV
jgi:hypothetical protein